MSDSAADHHAIVPAEIADALDVSDDFIESVVRLAEQGHTLPAIASNLGASEKSDAHAVSVVFEQWQEFKWLAEVRRMVSATVPASKLTALGISLEQATRVVAGMQKRRPLAETIRLLDAQDSPDLQEAISRVCDLWIAHGGSPEVSGEGTPDIDRIIDPSWREALGVSVERAQRIASLAEANNPLEDVLAAIEEDLEPQDRAAAVVIHRLAIQHQSQADGGVQQSIERLAKSGNSAAQTLIDLWRAEGATAGASELEGGESPKRPVGDDTLRPPEEVERDSEVSREPWHFDVDGRIDGLWVVGAGVGIALVGGAVSYLTGDLFTLGPWAVGGGLLLAAVGLLKVLFGATGDEILASRTIGPILLVAGALLALYQCG